MKNIRYWVRFTQIFVSKFKRLLLLSALFGVLVFLLLPKTKDFLNLFHQETVGYVGKYSADDLPQKIQKEISIGLTTLDESNNPKKGLADSWEAQDDGKVWIFHLGNHKWQDGSQIKAHDINYKFSDVTIQVTDEKTIKFILKDPFAPFPTVVSRPIFKKGLLGAGDWKVDKYNFSSSGNSRSVGLIRLVNTKTAKPKTYKFYLTEADARTAFKLGEVNELEDIVDPKEIKNWKAININPKTREDLYVGIFINNEDPLLMGKTVRQAMAYAIDKSSFEGERAISPLAPHSWAFNPQVKQYNYNANRAKELLKDIPKEELGQTIKLTTTPSLLAVAEKIKTNWEAVGIKTEVQVANSPSQDFQALLAIQAIPPDPDQYSFWHSTQVATNITNYRSGNCCKESPRIDKLLEEGRRTLDQEARKEIYLDFQRFLVEDIPVIFLYYPQTYTLKRN
jgi:peptide/nickel transport system substrate-binding protein